MKKVPFSQAGLDLKRKMLSELNPDEFKNSMEKLQRFPREWCLDNFLLNEDQITYLNSMPDLLIDQIGLNSRIAIEFEQPIVLETPEIYISPLSRTKPRKCKGYVKGGGTYSHSTGNLSYKLEVGIQLGL
jgi:hypothetical protein